MEESQRNEAMLTGQEPTEIQTYLTSFKQEIQADSDDAHDNKSEDENIDEPMPTRSKKSQENITYFAGTDGMLYAAQDTSQAVTLLAGSNGQVDPNVTGLHHVVFTVGESGSLMLSDPKNMTYSIPAAISSQSVEMSKSNDSDESFGKAPSLMLMQPAVAVSDENIMSIKDRTENMVSQTDGELQKVSPQIYQMISGDNEDETSKVSLTADGNMTVVKACDSYQTVTVVPSDTNPGQLSYVLFLSPENDESYTSANSNLSQLVLNETEKKSSKFASVDGELEVQDASTSVGTPQNQTNSAHTCKYCDYTSSKRYLLSRHMKSHSDERPHRCGVCERGFKTLASLQNHVNTHTKTRPHACKDCESCFTTSGELVRHIRYKHTHEKPHRCTECDYASVELSKLKRHMRCHTGERPYQCPHCTYASPDRYKLKRHMRIHTGEKPYICDVCQSRFTQSNSLKAHRLIHSGNKPSFQCQYCPTTCGRKTDLRIHMQKLHSCDKMHKCKRCGKVFRDRYSFKLHCKTHDGEKTFKCPHCPYATISVQLLESHALIHGSDEPYQCMTCGENFLQKQLLKQHISTDHGSKDSLSGPKNKNIKCTECGKLFRHHGNMIRHLAIHDPEASAAEQEEARRIGRPKEPGEIRDGEENKLSSDDDDLDNDQVVVFELIKLPKFSEDGNQLLTTPDGRMLTLEGNNTDGYTIVPQSYGECQNNDFSSMSDPEKVVDELGASGVLSIEFDSNNSEAELSEKSCQQNNDDSICKLSPRTVLKSPRIIQIKAEEVQSSMQATNGESALIVSECNEQSSETT